MTYLAVASFPYFTGLPEDVVVNTWHFNHDISVPTEGDFANFRDNLAVFYQTIYHQAGLGYAPWLRPFLNTLKIYNLEDPEPRPTVYDAAMALTLGTAPTTGTVPPEVAVCLSYQAVAMAGVPQARRRGRVFLGGLGTQAIFQGTVSSFPQVPSSQRTTIANAAIALGTSMAADNWVWVVYSRVLGSTANVSNGWIDDEIDTQRRRGRGATTRTLWDATP